MEKEQKTRVSEKIFGDWVTKETVQEFFNYKSTKMSTFAKDYNIRTAKVGRKIFYNFHDIIQLLNENSD